MAGKADLADHVANSVDGITKKQAGEAVDAMTGYIASCLRKGERVQIGGFGTFSVSERGARKGRNPATGATIHIAASKNVKFKSASTLKDSMNRKRKQ